jgi:hypothetical protein
MQSKYNCLSIISHICFALCILLSISANAVYISGHEFHIKLFNDFIYYIILNSVIAVAITLYLYINMVIKKKQYYFMIPSIFILYLNAILPYFASSYIDTYTYLYNYAIDRSVLPDIVYEDLYFRSAINLIFHEIYCKFIPAMVSYMVIIYVVKLVKGFLLGSKRDK